MADQCGRRWGEGEGRRGGEEGLWEAGGCSPAELGQLRGVQEVDLRSRKTLLGVSSRIECHVLVQVGACR